jgi:hypothetical protein
MSFCIPANCLKEDKSVMTRLLLAAACILSLPFWFSPSDGDKPTNSAPFASVAIAGHVVASGAPCVCGCPECVCDPGEENHKCSQNARPVSDEVSVYQGASPIRAHSRSGFDFGTGALMLALALFVWARLRA